MNEGFSKSDRRSFLKRGAGMVGGIVLAAGALPIAGCEKVDEKNPVAPPTGNGLTLEGKTLKIDVSHENFAFLANPGGYVLLTSLSGIQDRILVFRLDSTTVSVVSEVCTHQGCYMGPGEKGVISVDRLVCPCHGSSFLIADGSVANGPANTPIRKYPASIDGNVITADLS